MDFMNRNPQSSSQQTSTPQQPAASTSSRGDRARKVRGSKLARWGGLVLLLCILILVVAALGVLIFGNGDQSKFVNNKKYQAVFLTNGQVYFGHIKDMGSTFVQLDDIYYLTQNSSDTSGSSTTDTSNSNYTLVKLGCQQIHDPYDQMIINRSQVSFWENLQDSGKVVQGIQQFQKQNPNGPDCSQVSNQTQASTNAGAQGTNGSSSSDSSAANGTSGTTGTTGETKNP